MSHKLPPSMLAYEEWDDIIYHCPTAETFESKTGAGKNNWWDVVSVNQDCPGKARMEGKLTLERSKALELGPMSLDLCPSSISLCSVQFSPSVVSDSLQPHGLWHARPPCPSPTPEFTQTHVHWVSDTIQPSHPLSSPSPPALNLSQHQGLFKWVSPSHQVAKVLEFQLQHQSFQWIFRTDFL